MKLIRKTFGIATAADVREEQLETSRRELRINEAAFERARGVMEAAACSVSFHRARIARLEGAADLHHPNVSSIYAKEATR